VNSNANRPAISRNATRRNPHASAIYMRPVPMLQDQAGLIPVFQSHHTAPVLTFARCDHSDRLARVAVLPCFRSPQLQQISYYLSDTPTSEGWSALLRWQAD